MSDRRYVLFLLCAVYSLSALDRQILAILMQAIKSDLHLSDSGLGLLAGAAFAVVYVTLAVPIARIADAWNRIRIIAIAVSIFSVMTVLCSVAVNFLQFLLLRIGVGMGEAGTTPSSTSIIAELYSESERGRAMAWFAVGGCSGTFIGYALGGVIAQAFGWRAAFLLAGLPGIVVALLLLVSVRELKRAGSGSQDDIPRAVPARQVIHVLWRQRSLRHLTSGMALVLLFGYGFGTWLPSYFQRSFQLSVAEVGVVLGVFAGALSIVGMRVSGVLVDRLGQFDPRWRSWAVSLALLLMCPFCVVTALAPSRDVAMGAYAVPAILGAFYIAPTFALIQSLAPPHMRATAAATVIAVATLLGIGLGPQAVGLASDALQARLGKESLRYALLICTPILLWAAAHYYWAARHLVDDLARARDAA